MSKFIKIILVISLICNLGIIYIAKKAFEYRGNINEWLDKYVNVVEEFSGREYYSGQNKALKSNVIQENRIVFIGTQLIQNWDLGQSFPGYEVINRGISGQRVPGMILRFRPDVVELMPKMVVIEVSSYNLRAPQSLKEIQDYFITLIDLSRQNQIMPMALTMLPILADSAFVPEDDDYMIVDSINAYNNWLREYCRDNDVLLTELFEPLVNNEGYFKPALAADAIGPNMVGYDIIDDLVRDKIDSIMAKQ